MVCHYCNNNYNHCYSNLSLFRWWLRISCTNCFRNLACIDMRLSFILLVCLWDFSLGIEEKKLLRIRKTKERPWTLLQVPSMAKRIIINNINRSLICSYLLWWIWFISSWMDVNYLIKFSCLCFTYSYQVQKLRWSNLRCKQTRINY